MSTPQPGVITPLRGNDRTGRLNPVPEHLVLAAFDFVNQQEPGPSEVLRRLAAIVRDELGAVLSDASAETGELGFDDHYDTGSLTITLGISAGGFERLGVAEADRPADLRPIPWAALGDDPVNPASGDLVLQVCSDDLYVCEHVVRHVERDLGEHLRAVWTQVGAQRFGSHQGTVSRDEGRALIGFRDGTSNLRPRKDAADARLVLVDPDTLDEYPPHPLSGQDGGPVYPDDLPPVPDYEPEWTRNGTYLTVRASVFDTVQWDGRSQEDQQSAVGRFKVSGASLDRRDSSLDLHTAPVYATDPTDPTVPPTAHVRKAFPYEKPRSFYRHGYSIVYPDGVGGLKRGLAFIAFARTISTQFEYIVRAQMRNPHFPTRNAGVDALLPILSEEVICGGYYFVPAFRDSGGPSDWVLPATAE